MSDSIVTLANKLTLDAAEFNAQLKRTEAQAESFVKKMNDKRVTLGMDRMDQQLAAMQTKGLGGDRLQAARAAADQFRAAEAQQAALARGAALMREMQTPIEQYEARMAELSELLQRGAINQETFNRAAAAADQTLTRLAGVQTQQTDATARAADAEQKKAALMARGAAVTEAALTPAQRYQRTLAELNMLLKAGAISQETHTNAVTKAAMAMDRGSDRLTNFQMQMIKGGAQVAALHYLFVKLNEVVQAGTKSIDEYRMGNLTGAEAFGQFTVDLLHSIPIAGQVYDAAQALRNLFSGEQTEARRAATEIERLTEAHKALTKAQVDALNKIPDIEQRLLNMRRQVELLANPANADRLRAGFDRDDAIAYAASLDRMAASLGRLDADRVRDLAIQIKDQAAASYDAAVAAAAAAAAQTEVAAATQKQAEAAEGMRQLRGAIEDVNADIERLGMNEHQQRVFDFLVRFPGATVDEIAEFSDAVSKLDQAQDAQRRAQGIAGAIEDIERRVRTFGLTADQIKLIDLQAMGASDEDLAKFQASMDRLQKLEDQQKADGMKAEPAARPDMILAGSAEAQRLRYLGRQADAAAARDQVPKQQLAEQQRGNRIAGDALEELRRLSESLTVGWSV